MLPADEPGDAADIAHDIPAVVGHDHFHEHVTRKNFAFDFAFFVVLDLRDHFGGNLHLADQVLELLFSTAFSMFVATLFS